jgi:hypothetical protein
MTHNTNRIKQDLKVTILYGFKISLVPPLILPNNSDWD